MTIAAGGAQRALRRAARPAELGQVDRRRRRHRRVRREGRASWTRSTRARPTRAPTTATRCRSRPSLATLTQVLTPDAYEHFARLGTRLADGINAAIDEYGIPAHTVDLGCKGCVSYRREPLTNYRDFLETNTDALRRVLPVDGQPRRVHDARRRGAVDAVGAAHRRGHRPLRRRVRRRSVRPRA